MRLKNILRTGVLQLLQEFEVKISSSSDSQSTITGVGISEATYYFYRRFVGMGNRQLSELRSLQKEKAQLKKIFAELEPDRLIVDETMSQLKLTAWRPKCSIRMYPYMPEAGDTGAVDMPGD